MHAKRMFNQRAKRKLEITETRKPLNVVLLQSVWIPVCLCASVCVCLCVFTGERGVLLVSTHFNCHRIRL